MKNDSRLYKFTALGLIITMLSACTNIKDDGNRTRTEGALGGAALGALAGSFIGNKDDRTRNTLIGGAVGALAGLAYGDHVAKKKSSYASTEKYLNACIAQARKVKNTAIAKNNSLNSKYRSLQSRIASAKAQKNRAQLAKLKREVKDLRKEAKGQISTVDSEIKAQNYASSQGKGSSRQGALNSEIVKLKSARSSLDTTNKRFASLERTIDL